MEFKHINDCWNYLREAATKEDLEDRIEDLPIWSGDWDIEENEDGTCRVINSYYDDQCEDWYEDEEDFDIVFNEEEEE